MNKLLIAIIATGILCGASSCNLWRRVTGRQKASSVAVDSSIVVKTDSLRAQPDTAIVLTDTAVVVVPAPAIDSNKLALIRAWQPRWNAQLAYATFSGRAKVNYEGGGESQEFTVNIRMEKDKRIWVSITGLLGIEGARALITPDTIIAINRLQKEVRILPFTEVDKLLPVKADFATLQALIIGDVFPTGIAINDVVDTAQTVILAAVDTASIQQVRFDKPDSLSRDTMLISQTLASATSAITSSYLFYELINGRSFSKGRELLMKDGAAVHNISLEFSKVSFDEPVDMSFSIPSKYERK